MKKIFSLVLMIILMLVLAACGNASGSGTTWQEQYDLGMQYLENGEYSEAVVAFTAAISIEPNRASLYVARGDVYMAVAESLESTVLSSVADTSEIVWSNINVQFDDETYYTIPELYEKAIVDYEEAVRLIENGEAVDDDDSIANEAAAKLEEAEEKRDSVSNSEEEIESANQVENDLYDDRYNDYGSIEFTKRSHYQEFEDYSEEEQTFISGMVEAAETKNVEFVLELMEQFADERFNGSTIWNGYKIKASYQTNDNNSTAAIEMHPEAGTGYYLEVDQSAVQESVTYDYVVCPCIDWQWNGDYEEIWMWMPDNSSSTLCTVTGTMTEGLQNGEFYLEVSVSSAESDAGNYVGSFVELYEMGELSGSVEERFTVSTEYYGFSTDRDSFYFTYGTFKYFRETADFYW